MAFWPTYRFWENANVRYFYGYIKNYSDLLVAIFFGKGLGVKKDVSNIWHTFYVKKLWFLAYMSSKIFFGVKKIEKNRFSKNRSKSNLSMYIGSETCLGTSKGQFPAIYAYSSQYLTLCEKSIFCKNRDFCKISEFLIDHNLADWPAGIGRNHQIFSLTYFPGILEYFSYIGHHYTSSTSNFTAY